MNNRNKIMSFLMLAVWLALTFAAGGIGSQFMPGAWYAGLTKPSWNPPGWVFPPVWSLLYLLMGIAAWLVWCQGGFNANRKALGLFLAQLVLNALWTPLFFGLHRPGWAFLEIIVLWSCIGATAYHFGLRSRPAGLLLLPYLAWVTFAAFLNFTLWRLNP